MTKKIFSLSLFAIILYSLSASTYASKTLAECEKAEESPEQLSRCLDGVQIVLDRELQTWINNHTFNLEEKTLSTGRYAALKMFKRAQNDFTTFRDNNCRWQYLTISPEKGASLAYKKCFIRVTKARIKELSLL